jgi:hypothetical protein
MTAINTANHESNETHAPDDQTSHSQMGSNSEEFADLKETLPPVRR